jgi:hypothetical protein
VVDEVFVDGAGGFVSAFLGGADTVEPPLVPTTPGMRARFRSVCHHCDSLWPISMQAAMVVPAFLLETFVVVTSDGALVHA